MDHLITEARNPASAELDKLSTLELVRLMNREDAGVASAVALQLENVARAVDVIAERLRVGGRLVYVGAGTSGRLGVLDAAECPPTFSSPPGQVVGLIAGGLPALSRAVEGAEDHPEFAAQDLDAINFSAADALVGIASSGRTPYVEGALRHARQRGAFSVGLFCNPESDLHALVDVAITPVVGPEVLTGSTRLKAGTATKLVLNMLSTGVMVRLGKTYGNLMVDLKATNNKLRARSNRIVRQFTGITTEEADGLLQRCGGELKTALVAQRGGLSPDEARARLAKANGKVRIALVGLTSAAASAPSSMREDLLLGIDGGGSHTVALLAQRDANGHRVLGRGESGPSNLQGVGAARATQSLDEAVGRAFTAARLPRCAVASACLGLSGAGRPSDQQIIRDWASAATLATHVEITSDAALLLAAGTPEGWGIAIVSGTGSIAMGQNAAGATARAGGWGPLLGDEGSGYLLVLEALRAVSHAADGRGSATALTERFVTALHVARPQELVTAVHGRGLERGDLAALAPVVLEAAEAGDAIAAAIVRKGAAALAAAAGSVARQLNLTGAPLPLAFAGGVLLNSPFYRQQVLHELREVGVVPRAIALVAEPAQGALARALKLALAAGPSAHHN
jgi:N-acetylmuramic acid 6-phosphate etherase